MILTKYFEISGIFQRFLFSHEGVFRQARFIGTPTKRQVPKHQVSKRPVSKRLVSKRQVYKTSGLQNVRFTKRQVSKLLVLKRLVSKRP
jgi:hypothetical protein